MFRSLFWQLLKRQIRTKFPQVKQLSTEELAKQIETKPPVLLDVRTEAEFAVSHLLDARQINPRIEDFSSLDLPLDTPIVAYCSVGYRSSRLVDRLQQAGYTQAVNLEGSIFQWANEGRPVYRNGEIVQQVHPYNRVWGQLLKPNLRS
ncbi:rhodanese-like domain-containing protein [Microcoleus sp. FACHB-1515]|uniref:rhodanese-like domain-containing protein n=1 Tax=Cyanophyceae TaxID=3028117 RepID=UPI0016880F6F|nr:rhodanese-like domain-containing protein [Microcoleus sp. FACHB-1515]MBD2089334.1 rhodanese-like domain-containing protein [Microcoleus sp. FACHB-1515]